jgi:putative phage-type endonuclease
VADVIAKTKTGWGASRANYLAELVAERLTGVPAQGFTNAAIQHGTATEPAAREAYKAQTFDAVEQVGFVPHPFIEMSGASPDGLVGAEGMLEIKCPNTATHIETLLGGAIPAKYETQMQWQMACAGREWCDFVSFDPRLPPEMQLFVKRLDRDDKRIAELEEMVSDFLAELDEKVAKLTALYRKEAA